MNSIKATEGRDAIGGEQSGKLRRLSRVVRAIVDQFALEARVRVERIAAQFQVLVGVVPRRTYGIVLVVLVGYTAAVVVDRRRRADVLVPGYEGQIDIGRRCKVCRQRRRTSCTGAPHCQQHTDTQRGHQDREPAPCVSHRPLLSYDLWHFSEGLIEHQCPRDMVVPEVKSLSRNPS